MDLILWRHAEAEDREPDLARELTAKGRKHADRVGQWLDGQLPEHARILVSPAARAQQTAEGLRRKFRTVQELAPSTSPAAVLAAIEWPDGHDTVVVVGHQPTLGRLAALLVGGADADWSIRKGALWWLASRDREGGTGVLLRCVMSPEFC